MDLALTIASAVLAGVVIAAIVLLARGGGIALARVALPLGAALLAVQLVVDHWSIAGFGLLGAMIISAAALAVRGGGRDDGRTWLALGLFAIGGLVGGYGVLAHGLCEVGEGYGCAGTAFDVLAIGGWAVALVAYAYLYRGALRG